jgi:hypothetical protein
MLGIDTAGPGCYIRRFQYGDSNGCKDRGAGAAPLCGHRGHGGHLVHLEDVSLTVASLPADSRLAARGERIGALASPPPTPVIAAPENPFVWMRGRRSP